MHRHHLSLFWIWIIIMDICLYFSAAPFHLPLLIVDDLRFTVRVDFNAKQKNVSGYFA